MPEPASDEILAVLMEAMECASEVDTVCDICQGWSNHQATPEETTPTGGTDG